MIKVRVYSEFSLKVGMELEGVDEHTRDYDVQRHKKEVHDYLQSRLSAAFGDASDLTLHYFEFSLARQ